MSASRLLLHANPEQEKCGARAAKGIGNKCSTHLKRRTPPHPRIPEKTQLCARPRDMAHKQTASMKYFYGFRSGRLKNSGHVVLFLGKYFPFLSWMSTYIELGHQPGIRSSLIRENSMVGSCCGVLLGNSNTLTS